MHEQERERRETPTRKLATQGLVESKNGQRSKIVRLHRQNKTQCASFLDWLDNETSRRWLTFLLYYLVNIGLRRVLFQMFASQGVVVRPCKSVLTIAKWVPRMM